MDKCLYLKLNLAHQQDRKSLRYFSSGNIDASVSCHKKAAEYILEALKTTHSPKAKESLELQYQYHIKQQEIVRIKHRICQNRKKAREMEKEITVTLHEGSQTKSLPNQTDELRIEILRKMTENDSLLTFLNKKDQILVSNKMTFSDSQLHNEKYVKHEHKPNEVLEELKMNNRELKKMVLTLCDELDHSQKEKNELREKVTRLEKQLATANSSQRKQCEELFSPFCELTPSGGSRELPALAPLELPNFDYNSMKK